MTTTAPVKFAARLNGSSVFHRVDRRRVTETHIGTLCGRVERAAVWHLSTDSRVSCRDCARKGAR